MLKCADIKKKVAISGLAPNQVVVVRLTEFAGPDGLEVRYRRLPSGEIQPLNQGGESVAGTPLTSMPTRTEAIRTLPYRLHTRWERQGRAEKLAPMTSWSARGAASSRRVMKWGI